MSSKWTRSSVRKSRAAIVIVRKRYGARAYSGRPYLSPTYLQHISPAGARACDSMRPERWPVPQGRHVFGRVSRFSASSLLQLYVRMT